MRNIMKHKLLFLIISLSILVPGSISLIRSGLKPSIDFTGGTLWEIKLGDATADDINKIFDNSELTVSIQKSQDSYILRSKPISEKDHQQYKQELMGIGELTEIRFESVGPTLGRELMRKTIIAIITASALILLYVAWTFKNFKFGLAAILAMFHDSLILLGIFSILGWLKGIEVDTLFVTALLTTLSFSVHDTIVVFDRIRESLRQFPRASFEEIANKSVAETLARSINNSMTIIFMLLALFLLGGETIKHFVLALLIGTISGTYSSTFTAVPLLLIFSGEADPERSRRRKNK